MLTDSIGTVDPPLRPRNVLRRTVEGYHNMQLHGGPPTSVYESSVDLGSTYGENRRRRPAIAPKARPRRESSPATSDTLVDAPDQGPQRQRGSSPALPPPPEEHGMAASATPRQPTTHVQPALETIMCGAVGSVDSNDLLSELSDPARPDPLGPAFDAGGSDSEVEDSLSDLDDTCSLRAPEHPDRPTRAHRFAAALDRGLLALAADVLAMDRVRCRGGAALLSGNTEEFAAEHLLMPLLASMPTECLRAIINGELAAQAI